MVQGKFEMDTTHVVVQLSRSTLKILNGNKTIDLVPVAWMYQNNNHNFVNITHKKRIL